MYSNEKEIQKRVEEHYEEAQRLSYEIFGCFAQGSMNYAEGLFDELSDVDTKCLVVPSFKDICLGRKPVSITHVMDNGEHLDIKDIRLYFHTMKKQNINFIEILFTPYFKINPKYENLAEILFDYREDIAHYDEIRAVNCMLGMIFEKQRCMEHPFPSAKEKLEKYGYDGKQLCHAMRLFHFMTAYCINKPYLECLTGGNGTTLNRVKRNQKYNLDEAREMMTFIVEGGRAVADFFSAKNVQEPDDKKLVDCLLNEVQTEAIRRAIREEVI